MDNQHQKISGYRDLSQVEIDLMNEIKEVGVRLGELVDKLKTIEYGAPETVIKADQRWVAEGNTDLQKGIMSLVRSVAKPSTF